MNYSNLFRIAVRALIRNKLRAFLTMLGIIIGVASVIAMLAIGEGSKVNITKEMSSMGTNMVMVMPNMQRRGGVSLGASSSMVLKYSDVEAIRNAVESLQKVSNVIFTKLYESKAAQGENANADETVVEDAQQNDENNQ